MSNIILFYPSQIERAFRERGMDAFRVTLKNKGKVSTSVLEIYAQTENLPKQWYPVRLTLRKRKLGELFITEDPTKAISIIKDAFSYHLQKNFD